MKWLLLLPLLLLLTLVFASACTRSEAGTLRTEFRGEQQVNLVRFNHLLERVKALECAADPAKFKRIGMDCPDGGRP